MPSDSIYLIDEGTVFMRFEAGGIADASRQLAAETGLRLDTPAVLIAAGTLAGKQAVYGTLESLARLGEEAGIRPPAIILAGRKVIFEDKRSWAKRLPLFGKRVLVTRTREQASDLVNRIVRLGGETVEFPVIAVRSPSQPEAAAALDAVLNAVETFDWIIFTSANGVEFTLRRLKQLRKDIRSLSRARIAVVGPKTEETLAGYGMYPDLVPERSFQAETLLEALRTAAKPGEKFLIAKGDLARKVLPDGLRELGFDVTEADVYENVPAAEGGEDVLHMLRSGKLDAVTFTSSSTVTNLLAALRSLGEPEPEQLLNRTALVCIGPITAETARKAGLSVRIMSGEATIDSLVEALASVFAESVPQSNREEEA
jgi:uroporphyrinogen III methyltransferase/synthase